MRVADRGGGIELARRKCLDRERWRLFQKKRGVQNYRKINGIMNEKKKTISISF